MDKILFILLETIEQALEQNLLKSENAQTLAFMFWSSTHGMISLFLRNRMRMYEGIDFKKMISYTAEMILTQFLASTTNRR